MEHIRNILKKSGCNHETYNEIYNHIKYLNKSYREGNSIISDKEYDSLLEYYNIPEGHFMDEISYNNKVQMKIPYPMGSLEKEKTIKDLRNWYHKNTDNEDELLIITPKYDGISFFCDVYSSILISRGNGNVGSVYNNSWTKYLDIPKIEIGYRYLVGELIISNEKFNEKYKNEYSHPRNLVGGKMNALSSDEVSGFLKDFDYIIYGVKPYKGRKEILNKSDILKHLKHFYNSKIKFTEIKINDLSESYLNNLYDNWSKDYKIDGLVIEFDSYKLREKLGLETNSLNPKYSRAYKTEYFDERAESTVIGIQNFPNKDGKVKPVLCIEPTFLDGAEFNNLFIDNYRTLHDLGIGIGSKIIFKRSGGVIPRVTAVENIFFDNKKLEKLRSENEFNKDVSLFEKIYNIKSKFKLPEIFGGNYNWDNPKNPVELVLDNHELIDEVKLQRIIFFFESLNVKGIGDKTFQQLWDNGYNTIRKILEIKKNELSDLEGWGTKKSNVFYESIRKSLEKVTIIKLMHGSCLFPGMGEDKLKLVEHLGRNFTYEDLVNVVGISDITAKIYITGLAKFDKEFYPEIKDYINVSQEEKIKTIGDKCSGWNVCFTGFRNENLEKLIILNGGKITSGVTKNTTHLAIKKINSGSSKEKKAKELNIPIIEEEFFLNILNNKKEDSNLF
jgi:DNA ligase (NAD+)